MPPVPRDRAVWLIIVYKLVKAALWFAFAATIALSMRRGLDDRLVRVAEHLRHHARAWSIELAALILRAANRRGLQTIILALVADGSMSLVEGWALLHGSWWGPWVVVVSTGSFLPFEFVALARHPHAVRAAILLVNVAIVIYLARKALREHSSRARARAEQ